MKLSTLTTRLSLSLSLNGCLVFTDLRKEEESYASRISRVTLPSSEVIPPNTISNIPVTLEQSLPDDYIVEPMHDSRGLLSSTILQTFMQFIDDSNRCIKLPGGKCVGFAEVIGEDCLVGPSSNN